MIFIAQSHDYEVYVYFFYYPLELSQSLNYVMFRSFYQAHDRWYSLISFSLEVWAMFFSHWLCSSFFVKFNQLKNLLLDNFQITDCYWKKIFLFFILLKDLMYWAFCELADVLIRDVFAKDQAGYSSDRH